jgi:1-acyl-sn-glycerol-3-phosphate acyltransferase
VNKLNFIWRLLATGFCFIIFGLSALIISTVVFPLQTLFIKNKIKRKKVARYTIHRSFYYFVELMKFVGVLSVKLEAFEKLRGMRGHVIIANHPSLIDVVLIISQIPNADCVVKSQLFKHPFLRGAVKSVGYIDNQNAEQLFDDCKKSLDAGSNIVGFPEGTRTVEGEAINFKRGAANIAVRCKAHYQPILISVTPSTLTKKESWYDVPNKKVNITLSVQAPIDNSEYFSQANTSLAVRALTRETQTYFCKELERNDGH